MIRKEVTEFTEDEKNWMDTVAVNYIIAQSDGFQLGYATAVNNLTKYIADYWNCSDDKIQKSVLDVLVDLGEKIGARKRVAEDNVRRAKEEGYEQRCHWDFKINDEMFPRTMRLFTKEFESDKAIRDDEQESVMSEQEDAQNEQESDQNEQESDRVEIICEAGSEDADTQTDPEQTATEDNAPGKGYGKWSEYMGKALSALEENLIIKGMTEEGYTLRQI